MPISSFKANQKEVIVIPRNFILLNELEEIEKSPQYLGSVSYGLESYDDNILLERWEGVILSNKSDNVYKLKIFVGSNYPNEPPKFTFVDTKPNNCLLNTKGFILDNGHITRDFPLIKNWDSNMRIKDVLLSLKQYLI
jgi:ubiquitin-protein ligase